MVGPQLPRVLVVGELAASLGQTSPRVQVWLSGQVRDLLAMKVALVLFQ